MKAHIVIVRAAIGYELPLSTVLAEESSAELRQETKENWVGAGPHIRLDPDSHLAILEFYAPNAVTNDQVIAAVNRTICRLNPTLSVLEWETQIFCTIACMNQDR